jgi:hypothetical protein
MDLLDDALPYGVGWSNRVIVALNRPGCGHYRTEFGDLGATLSAGGQMCRLVGRY